MHTDWNKYKLLVGTKRDVLEAFEKVGWPVSYPEGKPILWEGEECEAIYFISSGMVEIYRTAVDGREHTLQILYTGESFNLVPVLTQDGRNRANARCIIPTDLMIVKKIDLDVIISKHPDFAIHIMQNLADRLTKMTQLAGELALHNVMQRTAAFLIREADKNFKDGVQRWTQDDMARQIGTVRDVVGRMLRQLEEKGLIKRNRGKISLIDKVGLERIANGGDTT